MRSAFVKTLEGLAEKDSSVHLLTADLGFMVFDKFKEKFPNQFTNCGCSEANMVSMAAGMAAEGKKPYIYSIAPFITSRVHEQLRNDIAYHNMDVKVIGVGGGFSYSNQGMSHIATEDIGLMRLLNNFKIVCPATPLEVEGAMKALYESPGPAYLRLGKSGEKEFHAAPLDFQLGKSITLKEGKDLVILCTGNILNTAMQVYDKLAEKDIYASVISMPSLVPIDRRAIVESASRQRGNILCTLEEHGLTGGLGDIVADIISQSTYHPKFKKFGVMNEYVKVSGSQDYLRKLNKIDSESITDYITRCLL